MFLQRKIPGSYLSNPPSQNVFHQRTGNLVLTSSLGVNVHWDRSVRHARQAETLDPDASASASPKVPPVGIFSLPSSCLLLASACGYKHHTAFLHRRKSWMKMRSEIRLPVPFLSDCAAISSSGKANENCFLC